MISSEEIIKRSRPVKRTNYYIYALIHNKKIVYIGQTSTLATRLGSHINSKKIFDSWSIIEDLGEYIHTDELLKKELQYIYTFKPKYNSQSKSFNFKKNKRNFLKKSI